MKKDIRVCFLAVSVKSDKAKKGDVKDLSCITIPLMIEYCKKYNYDFVLLTNQGEHFSPYWTRLDCKYLLKYYDYVVYCDIDVMVRKNSPNLIELMNLEDDWAVAALNVNNKKERSFRETQVEKRLEQLNRYVMTAKLPPVEWRTDLYVCSGCVIYSKYFLKYFEEPVLPEVCYTIRSIQDQNALNYAILSNKIKFTPLPPGFGVPDVGITDNDYFIHFFKDKKNDIKRDKIIKILKEDKKKWAQK
jgi:hypothetical protein